VVLIDCPLLLLAILVLLIWLYLFFLHSSFWRVDHFQLPAARSKEQRLVAAIVPARNEAELIGRAVNSLLRQDFPGELRLFIVDDNSSDGTANVARAAAGALGAPGKLIVLQGSTLPAGWTGKVWAMHQGWIAAREIRPDFVLLTDADIEHAPDNVARLIAQAEAHQYSLVSAMVKLRSQTLPEKFLIPAFVYFFFLLYPPERVADWRSRVAGAAGGCMLLRPEALEKAGGVQAICGEIIDDCSLAARVKNCGVRLWLGVTRETRSIRGYSSFPAIRDMIARTAFNQLRHSLLLLSGCVAAMLLTFVAPLALVWSKSQTVGWLSATACVLMFATYVPVLRLYGVNILSAVTLPFAAIFYLYATIYSAVNYWSGRGGAWKGRTQDGR
jgi:hopene-associated glycosyltransferase HpnB